MIEARHVRTGITRAVKVISKETTSEFTTALLDGEIEVVQQIEHPCIMKVIEVLEDQCNFYIVSELLSEELSARLCRRTCFSERDAAVIF